MRRFCLLVSMELILIPNCSHCICILIIKQFEKLFLKKEEVITVNIIVIETQIKLVGVRLIKRERKHDYLC